MPYQAKFTPRTGLLDGRVVPRISTGWRPRSQGFGWHNRLHSCAALVLHRGVLHVQDGSKRLRRLAAPQHLLVLPESGLRFDGERVDLDGIAFDLARRPGFDAYGSALPPLTTWRPPPTAVLVGRDLPLVVPPDQAAGFALMVAFGTDRWWRSELEAWRAATRLAAWLADFLHHLESADRARVSDGVLRLDQGHRVMDLVQASGLSRQTLMRRAKAEAGRSLGGLLRERRLLAAADLLAHSRRGIADIAATCGYAGARSLAPAFRARFGCTPRDWRRRHGGG